MTNKKLLDKLHGMNYNCHLFIRKAGFSDRRTFDSYQEAATLLVGESDARACIELLEKHIIPFLKIRGEK